MPRSSRRGAAGTMFRLTVLPVRPSLSTRTKAWPAGVLERNQKIDLARRNIVNRRGLVVHEHGRPAQRRAQRQQLRLRHRPSGELLSKQRG